MIIVIIVAAAVAIDSEGEISSGSFTQFASFCTDPTTNKKQNKTKKKNTHTHKQTFI